MATSRSCIAALLLLAAGAAQAFISISGTQFVTERCTPFVFSGYNTWQILENAAGIVGSKTDVTNQFDAAATYDFTVVRLFAFGTEAGFGLQTSLGQYNPAAFAALDYIISEAGKRGLRLVLALADNWVTDSNTDNKYAYVSYSSTAGGVQDAFYTDAQCSAAYQAHLLAMVNRVNTITGVAYKNDPTIFSWNLINEPRCDSPNCAPRVQAWIEKQSAYLKSIDSNHLVTVGEDGFWDAGSCNSDANPGTWSGSTGQDFAPNHAAAGIDYASVHLWPDNWERTDLDFGRFWVLNHTKNAVTLQKPMVIEEFGKEVNSSAADLTEANRLAYYKLIYFEVSQSFESGGPLQGVLFWRWDAVANVNLQAQGSPGTSAQTVDTDSSTFQQVIAPFAQQTSGMQNGSALAGCSVSGSVSTASVTNSSKPGPSYFAAPDITGIPGAFNGYVTGKLVSSTTASSATACSTACSGNAACNAWAYCFCDAGCSAGTVSGGTCQLHNQANNFYPRVDTTQGAGYVSGVIGASNVTQQWQCQPGSPSCTLAQVDTCSAASLRSSLQCPSATCNATQTNVGGNVITIDANGDVPGHPINTTAECCAACQQRAGCNVWTFCPYLQGCDSGCQSYVSTAAVGTSDPPFGPFSGCNGMAFPFGACTLKSSPGGLANATIYASGFAQPWVSGGV